MCKQPTLKEFIDNKRPGYPANAYVLFDGFDGLYVRHGNHYIDGKLISTLDLANITATKPGSGAFTKLVD